MAALLAAAWVCLWADQRAAYWDAKMVGSLAYVKAVSTVVLRVDLRAAETGQRWAENSAEVWASCWADLKAAWWGLL
jgi:hypothetical protein